MGHLPQIIIDLALLTVVAAVVMILFKKIKQPVVLGYILVGILIGPNFQWLPSVADMASITVWADIGVIFLMFALGLEFSFVKLANVGGTAIVTAATEMLLMIGTGFLCGTLLGWSFMNSLFLGGMLAISSTTIIIKAFDELGMRGRKFTGLVFGTLVVEDILGIFLMVLLSTLAVSQNISGADVALQIGQMMLYLVMWFVMSIALVPSLLKRVSRLINDEMLLIISVGLCLGMVALANAIGFSSALGAFIAGSILAGTVQAERIEHLVSPVKDLFGAVFFVSVGMLVVPSMLLEHIWPIVIITLLTVIAKPIFTALGALFSGQTLKTSVYCGLSLSQIGEFSFIIAALGLSLGVISDFLYPMIVSVSVVTTLTTPFMIKYSDKVAGFITRIMPGGLLNKLNRYTSESQSDIEQDSLWKAFLKKRFLNLAVFTVISLAVSELFAQLAAPFLAERLPAGFGEIVTTILVIIAISPFIASLFYRKRDGGVTMLWFKSKSNRLPLIAIMTLTVVVAVGMVAMVIYRFAGVHAMWIIVPALIITVLVARSDWLLSRFLKMEVHFISNLNERNLAEQKAQAVLELDGGARASKWLDEQLYVLRVDVPKGSLSHNRTLSDLTYKRFLRMNIVEIARGGKRIVIPGAKERIRAGDALYLLGEENEIRAFREGADESRLIAHKDEAQTLHSFIEAQDGRDDNNNLLCFVLEVSRDSELAGKSIKYSGIKEDYKCFVLALERNYYPVLNPDLNMVLEAGDLLWLLGGNQTATKLASSDLI